jgi:hypothetical protein
MWPSELSMHFYTIGADRKPTAELPRKERLLLIEYIF